MGPDEDYRYNEMSPIEMTSHSVSARENHRRLLHRLDRRKTLGFAAVVGIFSGLVAVIFRLLVTYTEESGRELAGKLAAFGPLLIIVGAALGGLAGYITQRFAPEAGGSGIPHVKAVLAGLRPFKPARVLIVKMFAGLIALGSGMSLGREGPSIHMGAASGALLGRWIRVPRRSQRALIAAGAGGGLAAAFNAPLAGFLFVMEELRREMSPVTYGTALIASVCSVAVARFLLGQDSAFALKDLPTVPLRTLPIVAIAGVFAAVIGLVFNQTLLRALEYRDRLNWPRWILGAFVGAAMAFLLQSWPDVTGGGNAWLARTMANPSQLGLLLAGLLAAKLIFTVLCYITGVPGGIFAPLLTLGAMAGLAGFELGHTFLPSFTPSAPLMITIGMASVLASSVRAPLTSVVLIVEMTGQYHLLYALLLASFIAYALAEFTHRHPIYEALMERDVHRDLEERISDANILEILVEAGSNFEDTLLRNLQLPAGSLVAIIERDGRNFAPNGRTRLIAGDLLTIVVSPDQTQGTLVTILDRAKAP